MSLLKLAPNSFLTMSSHPVPYNTDFHPLRGPLSMFGDMPGYHSWDRAYFWYVVGGDQYHYIVVMCRALDMLTTHTYTFEVRSSKVFSPPCPTHLPTT